jgi:hypothetical protein
MIGIVRAHGKGSDKRVTNGDPREDDLKQLALDISTAIEKARQLKLPTSAYILSMVLVEVSEAIKTADGDRQDDAMG